jgi:hypothetical protein
MHPPPPEGHYGYPPPPHQPPLPLRAPSRQSVQSGQSGEGDLDRRLRKNDQARQRSAQTRQRLTEIEAKSEWERTEEEIELLRQDKERRDQKNSQSRQRALLKKEREANIINKPAHERTPDEQAWLDDYNAKRKRKHEGDRLRRQRIKELGISARGGRKPGIPARGPLPPQYQAILQEKSGINHPPRAL